MDRRYIVAGHSHVFAMGVPQGGTEDRELVALENEKSPFFGIKERWNGIRDEQYFVHTAKHVEGNIVIIVWNGNQHNVNFLLAPDPLFDFYLDKNSIVMSGVKIVPKKVIRSHFMSLFGQFSKVIEIFQSKRPYKIIVLGTPAIKEDESFFKEKLHSSDLFQRLADKHQLDKRKMLVTPAAIRQKLWAVLQECNAEYAFKLGCDFLPVPPESLQQNGTLKREFWADDATHANKAYGDLVRSYILRSCRFL